MSIVGGWSKRMQESLGAFRKHQEPRACFCVGPQGGDPVCPCHMRSLHVEHGRYVETIYHGRYVETIDHGPVKWK